MSQMSELTLTIIRLGFLADALAATASANAGPEPR